MESELKERIAKHVEELGVEAAATVSRSFIDADILNSIIKGNNYNMARLKFHMSVLEYLYCYSDKVDKMFKAI